MTLTSLWCLFNVAYDSDVTSYAYCNPSRTCHLRALGLSPFLPILPIFILPRLSLCPVVFCFPFPIEMCLVGKYGNNNVKINWYQMYQSLDWYPGSHQLVSKVGINFPVERWLYPNTSRGLCIALVILYFGRHVFHWWKHKCVFSYKPVLLTIFFTGLLFYNFVFTCVLSLKNIVAAFGGEHVTCTDT